MARRFARRDQFVDPDRRAEHVAGGVSGKPEASIREWVRVGAKCSGRRGVPGVFLLAVGWVLAASGCGAALPF